MTKPWVLYPDLRDRVITLARSSSETELARIVPLTPGWTVVEVVAHVCGLNADIVEGAREDLGTDQRTEAQVSARRGMTVDEICDEWLSYDETMQTIAAQVPLLEERLAGDLVIHFHDVQHALGQEIDTEDRATISGAHVYAMRSPERWAQVAGASVMIMLSDGVRVGSPEAETTLRATPYDFLRSVSGRRSRRQVEALDWTGPTESVLEHFSPYASLGEVDADI